MEFVLTFHQPAEVFEVNDDPVRGAIAALAVRDYLAFRSYAYLLELGAQLGG